MLLSLCLLLASAAATAAETIVVVVRHAEKAVGDPKDPDLSEAGIARANRLAALLRNSRLSAAYGTQYKRTGQTALPAASQRGLPVQVREATRGNSATYASDLAREIQDQHAGGTVLVVGHSNTVPGIVKGLSGKDVPAISDDEYDRLYIITLGENPRLIEASY